MTFIYSKTFISHKIYNMIYKIPYSLKAVEHPLLSVLDDSRENLTV